MELNTLKIGQVSDLHIGGDNTLVQGIDVCGNFLDAIKSTTMQDIDLLVLSGDLADNAEPEAYGFILRKLKELGVPYCVIPGNHDNLTVMSKFLDVEIRGDRCYYHREVKGRHIFFLDSACGEVSREQLDWFQEETSKIEDEVILFMHHPPCSCDHKFMDSLYGLRNMGEVQACFSKIRNLTHIFCGHYHSPIVKKMGRQVVHAAPAIQMEIDSNATGFFMKSSRPGWVKIEWNEKSVETKVYF